MGRAAAAIGWAAVVVVVVFCGGAGAADTIADLAIDFRMNPLDGQVAPAFTLSALNGCSRRGLRSPYWRMRGGSPAKKCRSEPLPSRIWFKNSSIAGMV